MVSVSITVHFYLSLGAKLAQAIRYRSNQFMNGVFRLMNRWDSLKTRGRRSEVPILILKSQILIQPVDILIASLQYCH